MCGVLVAAVVVMLAQGPYLNVERGQPRSQGLSPLPPLSLRKDTPGYGWSRGSQKLGAKCVLREG